MRRLAERSGMRLSNVQYYFPSRNDVLRAMVALYFKECIDAITTLAADQTHKSMRARLRYVIREGLKHGETVSPLCRTFRELWAISSRNPEIHACLVTYYRLFGSKLVGFAIGDAQSGSMHDRLVTLIVPYLEGYSITGCALPCDVEETTELITDMAMSIVSKKNV